LQRLDFFTKGIALSAIPFFIIAIFHPENIYITMAIKLYALLYGLQSYTMYGTKAVVCLYCKPHLFAGFFAFIVLNGVDVKIFV